MEVFYGANKSSPVDFQEHSSRQTARQSSGHEEHPGKYPDFGSGFLRDELQKGVGMPLPGAFPEVSVIKCSNYGFASTSMSQVVDMFVFYKIQSILDSILLLSQS